jgi:hypothetical protein
MKRQSWQLDCSLKCVKQEHPKVNKAHLVTNKENMILRVIFIGLRKKIKIKSSNKK